MSDDVSIDNTNALELSDEEFLKLDFDSFEGADEEEQAKEDEETSELTEEDSKATEGESEEDDSDEEDLDEDEEELDEESDEDSEEDSDEDEAESKESTDEEEQEDTTPGSPKRKKKSVDSEDGKDSSEEVSNISYQEAYEKIFAPFKANGREVQVKTPEEVIQLMQMGANYNKKMAGMKPSLKILKMLDNHGLLDEQKLSYLIDLDKKDPNAISKLVKESGVDPLEIDVKASDDYKPNTYTVDERSVELDGILDDIKDTKSFNDTLDIIGNKWDTASKRIISENPSIIKIINQHLESGYYEKIQNAVETERMFGRLEGLSDIEAYKQVGDAINAKGGFGQPAQTTTESKSIKPKAKARKSVDPKLKSRKKAASSTSSTSSSNKADFNPLSLSDEEFEKMSASKFI